MNIPLKQAVREILKLVPNKHVNVQVHLDRYSCNPPDELSISFFAYTEGFEAETAPTLEEAVHNLSTKILSKQNASTLPQQQSSGLKESAMG